MERCTEAAQVRVSVRRDTVRKTRLAHPPLTLLYQLPSITQLTRCNRSEEAEHQMARTSESTL